MQAVDHAIEDCNHPTHSTTQLHLTIVPYLVWANLMQRFQGYFNYSGGIFAQKWEQFKPKDYPPPFKKPTTLEHRIAGEGSQVVVPTGPNKLLYIQVLQLIFPVPAPHWALNILFGPRTREIVADMKVASNVGFFFFGKLKKWV